MNSGPGRAWLIYLLFFFSGAAGLIYEISWSRQIGLLFGHTAQAGAVVLGAYFCGLAVGYLYASRIVSRLRHPLAGYAVAEVTVALWAIATPLLLRLLRAPELTQWLNSDLLWLQTLVRTLVSIVVLLPATAALGATLPFVAQHVSPPNAPQPRRIAIAYGFNTAGAVAGVLSATFLLILHAGVTGSSYVAAAISALCGIVAWGIRKNDAISVGTQLATSGVDKPSWADAASSAPTGLSPASIYIFAAISGFGTLALQVLYIRLFALTFHNSTYTFGSIAGVFLIALAFASWLYSWLAQRYDPLRIVLASALLGALTIPLSVLLMQRMTGLQYFDPPGGFASYISGSLGLIAAVIFLPVLLLGLILPALWSAARSTESGRIVGRITAWNTLAAAAGSIGAGFLLLPQLGLWWSFNAFAILYALTALTLSKRLGRRELLWAFVFLLLLLPQVVYLGGTETRRIARAEERGYKFLFNSDSPYGQIDVVDYKGERYLRQNRHYTLGATAGMDSELLQGELPLELHPAPRRVCYLGLATGITASAALRDERVEQITAIELIPDVVRAARKFTRHNGGIVTDPRAEVVINDARHFLYAGSEQFDVIISDLFVPWHSQTGYLYTVEHYRASRLRLADGGLFCQWLPLYQLSEREALIILDSFAAVFPYARLYFDDSNPHAALLAIVGTTEEHPALMEHDLYIADWQADGDVLNTDELPRVEFLAPISHREGGLLTGARLRQFAEMLRARSSN